MMDLVATLKPAVDLAAKQGISVTEAIKKLKEETKAVTDKETADVNASERLRKSAAQIQDQAIGKLNISGTILKTASEAFEIAVKKFADVVGVKQVPGGNIQSGMGIGGSNMGMTGPVTQGVRTPLQIPPGARLGSVSARWESGTKGSEAIGWDKKGGTSYGKYQISAKQGTMDQFIKFAEQQGHPEIAAKLRAAGSAETGSTGGKMPEVWKQLARSGELGDLEHQFIKATHFDPAYRSLKPDLQKQISDNPALQELLWSTAVQHGGSGKRGSGGAGDIFNKVYKPGMSGEDLVKAVYAERSTKFGGSAPAERNAVLYGRFPQEQAAILQMLKTQPKPSATTPAAELVDNISGVPTTPSKAPVAPTVPMTTVPAGTTAPLEGVQSPLSGSVNNLRDSIQNIASLGTIGKETGDMSATNDLLGQIVSLQREQNTGINRLIQNLIA